MKFEFRRFADDCLLFWFTFYTTFQLFQNWGCKKSDATDPSCVNVFVLSCSVERFAVFTSKLWEVHALTGPNRFLWSKTENLFQTMKAVQRFFSSSFHSCPAAVFIKWAQITQCLCSHQINGSVDPNNPENSLRLNSSSFSHPVFLPFSLVLYWDVLAIVHLCFFLKFCSLDFLPPRHLNWTNYSINIHKVQNNLYR